MTGAINREEPLLAVLIPTRNRTFAVEQYALPGLSKTSLRNFVCVIWDASDDRETERVAAEKRPFPLLYRKAPRAGLASQRNDAVLFTLKHCPSIKYIVFIDDDAELSPDALNGVLRTFREIAGVSIVNIPIHPFKKLSFKDRFSDSIKRIFGMQRHGVTSYLYNYGANDETPGEEADWASGAGFAVDAAVFKDDGIFFPEHFQRFGGYALGEDLAFTRFVGQKLRRRIVNSLEGHCLHYVAGSARLDVERMAASKWYNFHLLFDALYDEKKGFELFSLKLKFKLFMRLAALKLLFRARTWDFRPIFRGIGKAQRALEEYKKNENVENLMRYPQRVEDVS